MVFNPYQISQAFILAQKNMCCVIGQKKVSELDALKNRFLCKNM